MPSKKTLTLVGAVLIAVCGFLATAAPAFAASTEHVLYSFTDGTDGAYPGALISDGNGNLYGLTGSGGANGYGTVFELSPAEDGWTETTLYAFCPVSGCADGSNPSGGLVFDSEGNLYGTTFAGGSGCGVVYELSSAQGVWTESVLHSFAGADGCHPEAALIFDANGNAYGTTAGGGAYHGLNCYSAGCGTVFELAANTWTETILHSFHAPNSHDGLAPEAALVFGPTGNLYGTTVVGGSSCRGDSGGCGTVFELTQANGVWTESVIHFFSDSTKSPHTPNSSLIFDQHGNLYGTAAIYGHNGYGAAFELTPTKGGTWTGKIVYAFTSLKTGGDPLGLIFGANGSLYGTAEYGGTPTNECNDRGCGLVFRLTRGTNGKWTEAILHKFANNGKGGSAPSSVPIFDTVGNIYGTTGYGGSGFCNNDKITGCGTVFEITP